MFPLRASVEGVGGRFFFWGGAGLLFTEQHICVLYSVRFRMWSVRTFGGRASSPRHGRRDANQMSRPGTSKHKAALFTCSVFTQRGRKHALCKKHQFRNPFSFCRFYVVGLTIGARR